MNFNYCYYVDKKGASKCIIYKHTIQAISLLRCKGTKSTPTKVAFIMKSKEKISQLNAFCKW